MPGLLKVASSSSFVLALSTVAASAQSSGRWSFWNWFQGYIGAGASPGSSRQVSSVPEIDAGSGLLAIAAVLAAIALFWEIKRRRG